MSQNLIPCFSFSLIKKKKGKLGKANKKEENAKKEEAKAIAVKN